MEKREEGKTKDSLGFLPLFPAFPFFLNLTLSCPAVSLEFPVEIIFPGLSAVALSTFSFPVFPLYERLPLFLVGILGKALKSVSGVHPLFYLYAACVVYNTSSHINHTCPTFRHLVTFSDYHLQNAVPSLS
jgi:hypothetical protein